MEDILQTTKTHNMLTLTPACRQDSSNKTGTRVDLPTKTHTSLLPPTTRTHTHTQQPAKQPPFRTLDLFKK